MSLKQKISYLWGARKEKTAYWHNLFYFNTLFFLATLLQIIVWCNKYGLDRQQNKQIVEKLI